MALPTRTLPSGGTSGPVHGGYALPPPPPNVGCRVNTCCGADYLSVSRQSSVTCRSVIVQHWRIEFSGPGTEGRSRLQLWQNIPLTLWRCMERNELKIVLALPTLQTVPESLIELV